MNDVRLRGGRRDWQALFTERPDVQRDGFFDQLPYFLFCVTARNAPWQIRQIRRVAAVWRLLNDNEIVHMASLQPGLAKHGVLRANRNIAVHLTTRRDCDSACFARMLILQMASDGPDQSPAIFLDQFDQVAIFQMAPLVKNNE
jgi:hypothetical protein